MTTPDRAAPRTEAADKLRDLLTNRQMPDNATLKVTLGELRQAFGAAPGAALDVEAKRFYEGLSIESGAPLSEADERRLRDRLRPSEGWVGAPVLLAMCLIASIDRERAARRAGDVLTVTCPDCKHVAHWSGPCPVDNFVTGHCKCRVVAWCEDCGRTFESVAAARAHNYETGE